MSAGTGGTLAGVGRYLVKNLPKCKIVLVDPPGSVLYHRVKHGIAYTSQQQEQQLKRHRYDTLAEGIGLDRLTWNFLQGIVHDAVRVHDQEAVDMAHYILRTEGLWVGSSSAMNLVGAIQTARNLPLHSTIVTVICDGGQRHVTRFWNPDFVRNTCRLKWPEPGTPHNTRIPACLPQGLS